MTDTELLAERHYPYARLETHMLVDGVLYLRCQRCKKRQVPHDWSFVCLCDQCLSDGINTQTQGTIGPD